jgi:hypothetical protein
MSRQAARMVKGRKNSEERKIQSRAEDGDFEEEKSCNSRVEDG